MLSFVYFLFYICVVCCFYDFIAQMNSVNGWISTRPTVIIPTRTQADESMIEHIERLDVPIDDAVIDDDDDDIDIFNDEQVIPPSQSNSSDSNILISPASQPHNVTPDPIDQVEIDSSQSTVENAHYDIGTQVAVSMNDNTTQTDFAGLESPRMLTILNHQYLSFLRTYRAMYRNTFVGIETTQHLRMMVEIDRHFFNLKRTTNISPILISYIARNELNSLNFSNLDRMRMHFMALEIQRIDFELNAQRLRDSLVRVTQKIGCMLCDEYVKSGTTYFSGKCVHLYCDDCFTGITHRGVNTLCAFDRENLAIAGNSFQLKCQFNSEQSVICSLCRVPFTRDDAEDNGIFTLPSCGHIFHANCVVSNVYRCSTCTKPTDKNDVKLFAKWH